MNIYDKLAGEFRVSKCEARDAVYSIAWGLSKARILRDDFKARAWELLMCDREASDQILATGSKKFAACEVEGTCDAPAEDLPDCKLGEAGELPKAPCVVKWMRGSKVVDWNKSSREILEVAA